MKLMPIQLSPIQPGNARNNDAPLHSPSSIAAGSLFGQSVNGNANLDHRMSLFNHSELIWRYGPLTFSSAAPAAAAAATYPPLDFKNHLPTNLACDPRLWNKEDVLAFLHWCEIEFDLPRFDIDLFQMNGKALCLLTKQDLGERCPGAGDLIYNVLRWLIRDGTNGSQQHLPHSPVTPHFPITPSWCLPIPPPQDYSHVSSVAGSFHNSVTLSPAPSVDSQSGSPKQPDQSTSSAFAVTSNGNSYRNGVANGTNNSGSNQSDSEVEENADNVHSPTSMPLASSTSSPPYSPRPLSKSSSNQIFFPSTDNSNSSEPNTNGRLLWDFLQQLLNDSMQRYTNYITWKNRDSGVFKIVDPPGLAKLWGIQKNHLSMNYDKMSRALRYYYRVNILRKVQGERHCYQFLRNPSELKSIKNISLLRQQMSPSLNQSKVKPEPQEESMEDDIGPTDLSMNQNSSSRLQSPAVIKDNQERFQFPQDLSVSPMQLQVNMEARETFTRQLDNLPSSPNGVSSQIQIKVEEAS
ncbi:ets DNA-binding protein pokkuri [Planococcus citri]|uniref:ets DNA-binding protein pokkuri n=1 Tax=Planococcus citri TaxID=170843 RepID=UPI0031F9F887